MLLTEISCIAYKVFKDPVRLELRPLTVLVGKNNSGKSTLARLPVLLAHALSTRAIDLLDLEVGSLSFGASFLDLVHNRLQHGSLAFGARLTDGERRLELDVTVQNVSHLDRSEPVVSAFRLLGGGVDLELDWQRSPEKPPRYEGVGPVEFRGLLPHDPTLPEGTRTALDVWRRRFDAFFQQISHLGPFRPPVPRFSSKAPQLPDGLGDAGALVPQWLEAEDGLLDLVSAWYRENLDGWSVDLERSWKAFECVLRRGKAHIPFADAGEGMSQVLPVVVQQLRHRVRTPAACLDIVEHPELHLHPAAHAGLADLYVRSVKECPGVRLIVETHSETFLLRLRRRIAEGELDSSAVILYWVEELSGDRGSAVRRIEILPDGEVSDWPAGVFSESYDEVRAMRRAARKRAEVPA
jgi:hypothetical protein